MEPRWGALTASSAPVSWWMAAMAANVIAEYPPPPRWASAVGFPSKPGDAASAKIAA